MAVAGILFLAPEIRLYATGQNKPPIRAMEAMSSYAEKDKDIFGMLAWLERAANTGNINSIRIYNTYLMGGDEFTIPIPADMQSNKIACA